MKIIDLKGKRAVVTGAGSGIGRQIALTLADAGADVWAADIDAEAARSTCAEIEAAGRRSGWSETDTGKQSDVDSMTDEASEKLGGLDIFINSSGAVCAEHVDDVHRDALEKAAEVELFGIVYGCKAALRNMRRYSNRGCIVNITSASGDEGDAEHPFDSMSNAGAINITKSVALTGCSDGIRCNAVSVGAVRTDMWEQLMESAAAAAGQTDKEAYIDEFIERFIPLRSVQSCEDVANAVLFCCSELARSITGHVLYVDGGMSMGFKRPRPQSK